MYCCDGTDVMVSVIITAYNHEKYIEQTLNGVAKQKVNFNYEIIIHDDASPDNTQAIIKRFIAEHPSLTFLPVYQTVNQFSHGGGIGFKYIYPLVKGKYMITCEGDDYWIDENKLQTQVDFLEAHPEYVGTGHNCIFVDDDSKEYDKVPYNNYGPYIEHSFSLDRMAFGRIPGQTATLLYRSEVFFNAIESHLDDYRLLRTNGDIKRNFELLMHGDIYFMKEKMSAYRVVLDRGTSWSAKNYNSKERLIKSFISSRELRMYAKKCYDYHFRNYYQSFSLLNIALKKALKGDSSDKEILSRLKKECPEHIPFLVYYVGLGLVSVPAFIQFRRTRKRYILNEN